VDNGAFTPYRIGRNVNGFALNSFFFPLKRFLHSLASVLIAPSFVYFFVLHKGRVMVTWGFTIRLKYAWF